MIRFISLVLIFAFIVNSCKKENMYDCFKPSGPTEVRNKELSGFKRVEVLDKIDVYITQGNFYEVKIEAGRNLFMNIKTYIKDSTLYIENINKCNFVRSPKKKIVAYITLPYLRSVRNAGTGNTYFTNRFVQDSLDIKIANSGDVHCNIDVHYFATSTHGNGDIYAEGKVNYSSHYTNGTNYLRMQDVVVQSQMDLNTYTIGDCYINAPLSGPMKIEIWEKGNVHYKGNPSSINLSRYSKGQLIKD